MDKLGFHLGSGRTDIQIDIHYIGITVQTYRDVCMYAGMEIQIDKTIDIQIHLQIDIHYIGITVRTWRVVCMYGWTYRYTKR